jgi:hypothetical protein
VTVSFACSDVLSGDRNLFRTYNDNRRRQLTKHDRRSDKAGNTATTSRAVNVDKPPPTIKLPEEFLLWQRQQHGEIKFPRFDVLGVDGRSSHPKTSLASRHLIYG